MKMQITILQCKLFKFCGSTYHHYATSLFALCGAFSVVGNGKVLRQQKITMETLNITMKFSAQIACRDLMKIYVCMNEGFHEREDEELNHNKKLYSFHRE